MRGWIFLIGTVIALLIDTVICDFPDFPERFKLDLNDAWLDQGEAVQTRPNPCAIQALMGLVFVKVEEKNTWKSFTQSSGSAWQSTDYVFDTGRFGDHQVTFSEKTVCLEYNSEKARLEYWIDGEWEDVPIASIEEDFMKTEESSPMKTEENPPMKTEDNSPMKTEESSPNNDTSTGHSPMKTEDNSPMKTEESSPKNARSTGQKVAVTYNHYSWIFGSTFQTVSLDPAIQDCASTRIAIEVAAAEPRAKVVSLSGPNGEKIHVDNCDSSTNLKNSAWTVSDEIEVMWRATETSATSDAEPGGGRFAWWTILLIVVGPVACFLMFYVLVYFCRTRLHASSESDYTFTLAELGTWE